MKIVEITVWDETGRKRRDEYWLTEGDYNKFTDTIEALFEGVKPTDEEPKAEMPTKHNKIRMADLEDNIHPEIMPNLLIEQDVDNYVVEVAFKEFDRNKQNWWDVNAFLTENGFKWTKREDQKKGSWIL